MTDPDPTPNTEKPCRCWTELWTQHDGHCCFSVESPEDCHDREAAQDYRDRCQDPRSHAGPMMARRYWLTDKGYEALAKIGRAS